MQYLPLVIYIWLYKKKDPERSFFNVFLMPILALFYFLRFKHHNVFVYLAILAFWIGDVLCTKRNKKNILMGIPLFILGIAFYVIKLLTLIKNFKFKLFACPIYYGGIFRISIFRSNHILWNTQVNTLKEILFSYMLLQFFKRFALYLSNLKCNFNIQKWSMVFDFRKQFILNFKFTFPICSIYKE